MGYLERLSSPLSCFIIHIRLRTYSSHSASQGSPERGLQPPHDQGYLFPFFFCEAHYFSYVIDLLGLTRLCSHVLLPAFFFKVFHCCFTLNENDFEAPVSC